MFNKKLKEEINLLAQKIQEQSNKVEELENIKDFLLCHNKDEVLATTMWSRTAYATYDKVLNLDYIHFAELKRLSKTIDDNMEVSGVQDLKNGTVIITLKDIENTEYHYLLNKDKGELTDVTALLKWKNEINIAGKKIGETLKDAGAVLDKWVNDIIKVKKEKETVGKKVKETKVKPERKKFSKLSRYYDKYQLNLSVKDFKPIHNLDEKDVATLLYLFDNYKYVYEIEKHIDLKKLSIEKYAYWLAQHGYLIYSRGMGRVANGCLIYNKESK